VTEIGTEICSGEEEPARGSSAPLPAAQQPGESPAKARRGVRELVAAFILRHQSRVRRIARRKLTAETCSVFDSEDVLSSVLRRLDGLAARGEVRTESEAELWAMVRTVAANLAVDKSRLVERAKVWEREDALVSQSGRQLAALAASCRDDDEARVLVLRMMASLEDSADRQLFSLLCRGCSHRVIASLLNITEESSRQRWRRIRERLAAAFPQEQ
jgi:DNA-directed RNA polymerase specialized sigma24 family protein